MVRLSAYTLALLCACAPHGGVAAAGACVMAKWQGNTLDYALAVVDGHPVDAQEQAQQRLRDQGYGTFGARVDVLHPQALTDLERGHLVVIKTTYKNWRGRDRSSYGCGFSGASQEEALWEALRDLQSHSWGWKPDQHGYEILEQRRF